MRSLYKIHDPEGIYFTTSSVIEWIPIFTSQLYFDVLIQSIKYCQAEKSLKVYAYVILENHFHMICQAPNLSGVMQSLKRHTAKSILDQLRKDQREWILNLLQFYKKRHKQESHHQLWQEGFHPQQIASDDMFRQKIDYIHANPVKRGYVTLPEHWYYCSASTLLCDEEGPVKLDALPF